MKNFNLALFLGCCVIGISLVISGYIIASNIPEIPNIPTSISLSNVGEKEFGEYLSLYGASLYLSVSESDILALINSGELEYCGVKIGDSYVISKSSLDSWLEQQIGRSSMKD